MRAHPTSDNCAPRRSRPGEVWTFDRIVADYIENKRPRLAGFLRFYAIQRSLVDAIEKAAYAKTPSGNKHSHQRRLPREASAKASRALRARNLTACRSFAELHATVERAIRAIDKVGELMVYDTALRLGALLKLEPEFIYLHAGTQDGAAALGIHRSRETVAREELPPTFRALRSCETEDCLWVYKSQLKELGRRQRWPDTWSGKHHRR